MIKMLLKAIVLFNVRWKLLVFNLVSQGAIEYVDTPAGIPPGEDALRK